MPERLVVIHNPVSTHSKEVQRNVLGRLDDTGVRYESIQTRCGLYGDNVDEFAGRVEAGARYLIAAGDGTATQFVHGAIKSGQPGVEIGFLPYGNFNDMATGYNGTSRAVDPLRFVGEGVTRSAVTPIRIDVDDQPWRYAPAYATLGWTAAATELFMQPHHRESLRNQHKHLVTAQSFASLFREYLRRRKEMALPRYTLNDDREIRTRITDVVAHNHRRMGRVIRRHAWRVDSSHFQFAELDVSTLYRNAGFLTRSFIGDMPGDNQPTQRLYFQQPSSLPFQNEGEYAQLEDITSLTFTKEHDETFTVVHPVNATMKTT